MGANQQMMIAQQITAAAGLSVITAKVASAVGPTSGTTITLAVDCTGANALFVHYLASAATAFTGVSATYNGSAMTEEYRQDPFSAAFYEGCFSIISPTTGTNNVVITVTGSALNASVIGGTPMTGVNTSTPTRTAATAFDVSGTSGTATVSCTSANGDLVLGFVDANQPTITNGGGQTTVWSVTDGSTTFRVTSQAGATSTVSPSFTFTAAPWLIKAQSVRP